VAPQDFRGGVLIIERSALWDDHGGTFGGCDVGKNASLRG
jgi:hypothetical protein